VLLEGDFLSIRLRLAEALPERLRVFAAANGEEALDGIII